MPTIRIEAKSIAYRVVLRFVKAFVAGGLAGMILVAPLNGFDITDIKVWVVALLNAFVVGGLLSLEKLLRR